MSRFLDQVVHLIQYYLMLVAVVIVVVADDDAYLLWLHDFCCCHSLPGLKLNHLILNLTMNFHLHHGLVY